MGGMNAAEPGRMENHSAVDQRLRDAFDRAREVVLRAHERAQQAVDRAARIREALRGDRENVSAGQQEARRRVRLLQLMAEESARSAREKDKFLATVSHELRQPLNAALAALRIIEVGGEPAASARAVLRRQLLQMTRLVDDLLDMSRMSLDVMDMRLGHVDMRAVLDDAVAAIEPELLAHRLTIVKPPLQSTSEVCVWGDDSRLRQVFSNLLSNAVRYTPPDGQITLAAAVERAHVIVTVTDTGQGIQESDLARIFDPFTRGEMTGEGFGIGLALVRAIVELHRGSTTASSAGAGQGSTFTVRLPRCPHPLIKGSASSDEKQAATE
jgi:signal transduction histidine kinase